jgi:dipeptide/tripeptide permease
VQKHALALGYFFLAVFCILTSAHSFIELRLPLLFAAVLAIIVGTGYIARPLSEILSLMGRQLLSIPSWLAKMVRLAQEPPHRGPVSNDEKSL